MYEKVGHLMTRRMNIGNVSRKTGVQDGHIHQSSMPRSQVRHIWGHETILNSFFLDDSYPAVHCYLRKFEHFHVMEALRCLYDQSVCMGIRLTQTSTREQGDHASDRTGCCTEIALCGRLYVHHWRDSSDIDVRGM